MKKIFYAIVILFIVSSCKDSNKAYENVLGGKHELRKFNVKTSNQTSSSGYYFLVAGGYNSETVENSVVRFYFKNYRDEYQLLEMPITKVNVRIDSTAIKPYVKFYWNEEGGYGVKECQKMYEYSITRAVICCRDSDFQPEININDLK